MVIAASAGSLTPLRTIASHLPAAFPAAILVASHTPAGQRSRLPVILSSVGPLPAWHPRDVEPIEPGNIYVAPSDHHLLVERGATARLDRGPREHGLRPAADPLFRSAAMTAGSRAIGVVLSGQGRDGAGGVGAIQAAGGVGIVQAPEDAEFPFMPRNALAAVRPYACLPAAALAPMLEDLVRERLYAIHVPPGVREQVSARADDAASFTGMKVLVAEDQPLVASQIVWMARELGCTTKGPVPDVPSGLRLLEGDADGLGCAVLDVDLRGELVFPLASALLERGIPIVFATGYGPEVLSEPWSSYPYLQKPFDSTALASALRKARSSTRADVQGARSSGRDGRCAELLRRSRDLLMHSRALRQASEHRIREAHRCAPRQGARGQNIRGDAKGRARKALRRRRMRRSRT